MGKPYKLELQKLEHTYKWALQLPLEHFQGQISAISKMPLIAVGSGGSLTACRIACQLHSACTGQIAAPVTPLELLHSSVNLRNAAVLIISAGGNNPDILEALRGAIAREPHRLMVICSRTPSPLAHIAARYKHVSVLDFAPPSKKDGFLATNSLIAFCTMLAKLYLAELKEEVIPHSLSALVFNKKNSEAYFNEVDKKCTPLWDRETLLVLHGNGASAGAMDLESKFHESALGTIQVADYRNFAHGRHQWLALRGTSTGVLALSTDMDKELCHRTLDIIPKDVPRAQFHFGGGILAGLASVVSSLFIVGSKAAHAQFDPGRPRVSQFGRKLYRLRALKHITHNANALNTTEQIAIERKSGSTVSTLYTKTRLPFWEDALSAFLKSLRATCFPAVALDYDGTLCAPQDRYNGIQESIARFLTALLAKSIVVGIATGRGKSVRDDLQKKIPRGLWPGVLIAYYNGGEIAGLTETNRPDNRPKPSPQLAPLVDALQTDSFLGRQAEVTVRKCQITIEPKPGFDCTGAYVIVSDILSRRPTNGVTVVRSTHSVDVLAPGVSKKALLASLRDNILRRPDAPVLCIGDLGRWPGNDFELLAEPLSLSVDEVSEDPRTCWNISPIGVRGTQAMEYYFRMMKPTSKGLRVLA